MPRVSISSSSLILVVLLVLVLTIMANSVENEESAVHIVFCEKPEGEEAEAFHIKTLSSVLGSEEAAKGAIVYSYKTAASGFAAKLTPEQVSQISKEPGVVKVIPSRTYQLHGGVSRIN